MSKKKTLTNNELEKIYNILKAFDEGLIVNPTKNWELDHYDEKLVDNKGLKPILSKIKLVLPKKSFDKIEKKVLVRKYDTLNNQIDAGVHKTVDKAFNNKLRLEIEYFSMQEEAAIKRKIDIYAKNSKYIIGYCHLRNAIRKFRLSRIIKAKITNEIYKIPIDFDKGDYLWIIYFSFIFNFLTIFVLISGIFINSLIK